jgi:hypothetical protein
VDCTAATNARNAYNKALRPKANSDWLTARHMFQQFDTDLIAVENAARQAPKPPRPPETSSGLDL